VQGRIIISIYIILSHHQANIFINGLPAEETREWFIKNSGYVLQLATPYHEELTVRQNLTYSAMMRLPMKMKMQDKMWRVEQVLGQVIMSISVKHLMYKICKIHDYRLYLCHNPGSFSCEYLANG